MEYRAIFKCRLCGKSYESGCTGNKKIAMNAITGACQGFPLVIQQPQMTEVHCCSDGSYGVADFQGFKKMDERAPQFDKSKTIESIRDILMSSGAITTDFTYRTMPYAEKQLFEVPDGCHVTVDYNKMAAAIYEAGFMKKEES